MTLTIHVLGLGGVGKLIANNLPASIQAPSVTLLFHRAGLAAQWRESGNCIDVITKGVSKRQSNLRIEEIHSGVKQDESVIQNLIVATKTYTTSTALRPIKHRLTADSSILFLQNGMGTIDEVNDTLFPTQLMRPRCIAGVVNHGVVQTSAFTVIHTAASQMTLGLAPVQGIDGSKQTLTPASRTFLDCICDAPLLNAKMATQDHILFLQLQKLAVNAVINPLTSLLRCPNGELYDRLARSTLIKDFVREIAAVLQSYLQTASLGKADNALFDQLSAVRLEETVSNAAIRTAENTSSMCQDMLADRRTEVDYINGWIAARASELGRDAHINGKIVDLVQRREKMTGDQLARSLLSR